MPKKFNPNPKSKFLNSKKKKPVHKPSRKERESPEDEESENEGHVSDMWKREVTKVLKSFIASPGFGDL